MEGAGKGAEPTLLKGDVNGGDGGSVRDWNGRFSLCNVDLDS